MLTPVSPGLCGNFNSNQADDFRTLSGVVEGTAAAFTNTWKTQAACPNVKNSFEDPCSLSVENGVCARAPSFRGVGRDSPPHSTPKWGSRVGNLTSMCVCCSPDKVCRGTRVLQVGQVAGRGQALAPGWGLLGSGLGAAAENCFVWSAKNSWRKEVRTRARVRPSDSTRPAC